MQQAHLQQILYPCQNLSYVERFADKVQGAGLQCSEFFIGLGGNDKDRRDALWFYTFEGLYDLKTVHLWHIQI